MGMKVKKNINKWFETTRRKNWPSIDDAANTLINKYEKAISKRPDSKRYEPNMIHDPAIYSIVRKAITIGVATGIAIATWYFSGCNEKEPDKEYNKFINYSSNVSIQK